jgi:hypothetical protein
MKKITMMLTCMLSVAACSQMTTNKSELAALQTTADISGDAYVGCVVKNSLSNTSKNVIDVATAVQLAGNVCQTELNQFKGDQEEYLGAQVMLTKKPLQESVTALDERATTEVGEALLAAADSSPAVTVPLAAGTAATVTSGAGAVPPSSGWDAEQRVYLDCMEDQARKYAGLDETASVIADVAQSRCKSYMPGAGMAALEQEGRTLVMGTVLDAKLAGPDRLAVPSAN